MKTHEIVVWPSFLDALDASSKVSRLEDVPGRFEVGDDVLFRVWWDGEFTGEEARRRVVRVERLTALPAWVVLHVESEVEDGS